MAEPKCWSPGARRFYHRISPLSIRIIHDVFSLAEAHTLYMENKTLYIFDLDHTLICSKHRTLTKADGSLDLAAWRENCTREKIFADSLLPLADYALQLIRRGENVIACTARVFSEHDHDFLQAHGLHFARILSRPEGCTLPDWQLKERMLREDAEAQGIAFSRYAFNAMMFDDNREVLQTAKRLGIIAFNAVTLNKAAA